VLGILVTRRVINGFSGFMNRFIGQSPGESTNTCNTSKGYWNNNTKSSTLPPFCLVLGFCYSVGLSSISSLMSSVFCLPLMISSLDQSWLHSVAKVHFLVFAVVTETCLQLLCEQSLHSRCNRNVSVRVA
jgi:hypothetical protein